MTEETKPEEKPVEKPAVSLEEFSALKEELERFKAKHQEAEKHRKQAEKAAQEAAEKVAKESGNIEALEKSWADKLKAREAELSQQLESSQTWINELTVGQTATSLAAELAVQGSAKALLPHIRSRLKTEVRDGKPTVVVLDAEGKPSAATIDDLKSEFMNDPAFGPLIVGSKASGPGRPNGSGGSAPSAPSVMYGDKQSRLNAIKSRFPDLPER